MMFTNGNSLLFPDPEQVAQPGEELLLFVQSAHRSPAAVHLLISTNHAEPLLAVIRVSEAQRLSEDLAAAVQFVAHAQRPRADAADASP